MSDPAASFNDQVIAEFRETGGTVARFGRGLVLIHHLGAKTGVERIAPARGLRIDADAWLVAAWKAFTDASPGFLDYEKKTTRTIPMLKLTRRR